MASSAPMTPDIRTAEDILAALRKSDLWTNKTVVVGGYVQNIVCPECGEPEAFTDENRPFALLCNRKNKCGVKIKMRNVVPEAFEGYEVRYPPVPKDPNRPARAYLEGRGIDSTTLGSARYKFHPDVRKSGAGGVLFYVGRNSSGKEAWQGRIFDPPRGVQKGAGYGRLDDLVWAHPDDQFGPDVDVYVVEGILDALSLRAAGLTAIATLGTLRDPTKMTLPPARKYIRAFDSDDAGWKTHRLWDAVYGDAESVSLKPGVDWNDLLIRLGGGPQLGAYINSEWSELRFRGRLCLSESAISFAETFFDHRGYAPGLFEYDGCYWYSGVDRKKKEPSVYATRVADFTLETTGFLLDNSNPDEPVYQYAVRAKPADKRRGITDFLFNPSEMCTPNQVQVTLLKRTRSLWTGTQPAVNALIEKVIGARAPVVRKMGAKGYDPETGAFVMNRFAILRTGQVVEADGRGIVPATRKVKLRPAPFPDITPRDGGDLPDALGLMVDAWGYKAAVSAAWIAASFFVHEIKKELRFFPFLSLYGHPSTGKTGLASACNGLQCLEEEGLPMSEVNTQVGYARMLNQRSCLARFLLEGAPDRKSKFDIRTLLTAFNDAPLQVRGVKSGDNRTDELVFQGTLAFAQNVEPFRTRQEHSRVISLYFDAAHLTADTKHAFDRLIRIPRENMGWFLVSIARRRRVILERWRSIYDDELARIVSSGVRNYRIAEVHAIPAAFWRIASDIVGYSLPGVTEAICEMALEKERRTMNDDGPIAGYFFDVLGGLIRNENIDTSLFVQEHEMTGELRLHLPSVLRAMEQSGFPIRVDLESLQSALESHPDFRRKGQVVRYRGFNGASSTTKTNSSYVFSGSVISRAVLVDTDFSQ